MGKQIILLLLSILVLGISCKEQQRNQVEDEDELQIETEKTLESYSKTYLEAWSNNDTSLVKHIVIRNFVRNVNGEITSSNQTGLMLKMNFWHTALPDFKVVENEIMVDGNRSFINWTSKGTNTGMFGEMTPTGKKSKTEGFSVLTFDDSGQLIHENTFYDFLGVMQDWGYTLLPPNME